MATTTAVNFQSILELQHDKAFQKQKCGKLGKAVLRGTKAQRRYWKNIGLGFQTPKEAKTGRYIDNKCPFTSDVSIRGRIMKGMVVSTKMRRSIVVRRHYLHYVAKYNRYEKRHRNTTVHCSPAFDVHEGDIVTFGQCRPISKTIRFNVIAHEKNQIIGTAKKQFRMF